MRERFQSTPPARGATPLMISILRSILEFQSTPPARGATSASPQTEDSDQSISIHAPREGGDSKDAQFYLRIFDK